MDVFWIIQTEQDPVALITTGAFQTTQASHNVSSAFVTKLNPNGSAPV